MSVSFTFVYKGKAAYFRTDLVPSPADGGEKAPNMPSTRVLPVNNGQAQGTVSFDPDDEMFYYGAFGMATTGPESSLAGNANTANPQVSFGVPNGGFSPGSTVTFTDGAGRWLDATVS